MIITTAATFVTVVALMKSITNFYLKSTLKGDNGERVTM